MMNKLLFIFFLPIVGLSQNNTELKIKGSVNHPQQSSTNMLHNSITSKIENSANHNRRNNEILTNSFKIAFGSCADQNNELPIFKNIVKKQPDLFIFLGDNIYGDTKNMDDLKQSYKLLAEKKSFINLTKNIPIIATWDDHDYGWNDIGKEYTFKKESKNIFLDFFKVPKTSLRRQHDGIYGVYYYHTSSLNIQVILLDERTFRDPLIAKSADFKQDDRYSFYKQDYQPNKDSNLSILGKEQWKWLEMELKKSADIRIICSATQFGIEWNGYEAWANFPSEKKKMIDLIEQTKANGVLFISGDVHYSEISKTNTNFYPIYDFTSSGLSSTWKFATPNKYRIEGPVMENNFGLLTIDENNKNASIKMETWDINNNQRIEYIVKLSELTHH